MSMSTPQRRGRAQNFEAAAVNRGNDARSSTGGQDGGDARCSAPANLNHGPHGLLALAQSYYGPRGEKTFHSVGGVDMVKDMGFNMDSTTPLYKQMNHPLGYGTRKHWERENDEIPEYQCSKHWGMKAKLTPTPEMLKFMPEEILFFTFYTFTQSEVQMVAADELKNRDWRFDMINKLWIHPVPSAPIYHKTELGCRTFVNLFDPWNWKTVGRVYDLIYAHIEHVKDPKQ